MASSSSAVTSSRASSSVTVVRSLVDLGHQLFSSESFKALEGVFTDNERLQAENKEQNNARETLVRDLSKVYEEQKKLTEDMREQKAKAASLEDVKKKLQILEKERDAARGEVKKYQRFYTFLRDENIENYAEKCSSMRNHAANLITCFFGFSDASPHSNTRTDKPEKLEKHPYLNNKIALPASKSSVAREMRVAALMAIFGRSLCRHVFLPCHILSSSYHSYTLSEGGQGDEVAELEEVMAALARLDATHEYHARSVLLSVLPKKQDTNLSESIDIVVNEVSQYAQSFLSLPGTRQEFEKLLQEACEGISAIWREIQRMRWKVEPSLGPIYDDEEEEWEVFQLPGTDLVTSNSSSASSTSSFASSSSTSAAAGAKGKGRTKEKVNPTNGGGNSSSMKDETVNGNTNSPTKKLPPGIDRKEIHFVLWPSFTVIRSDGEVVISKGIVLLKSQADRATKEKDEVQPPRISRRERRVSERLENGARMNGIRNGVAKSNGKEKEVESPFLFPGGGGGPKGGGS